MASRRKRGVARVSSPFTVESEQPWATVIPLDGDTVDTCSGEPVVAHDDFLEAVSTALAADATTPT